MKVQSTGETVRFAEFGVTVVAVDCHSVKPPKNSTKPRLKVMFNYCLKDGSMLSLDPLIINLKAALVTPADMFLSIERSGKAKAYVWEKLKTPFVFRKAR